MNNVEKRYALSLLSNRRIIMSIDENDITEDQALSIDDVCS